MCFARDRAASHVGRMIKRIFFALLALPILAACGNAELAQSTAALKEAAVDVAGDAAKAAGGVVDTQTVCMLAGQSPAFCGCLQAELGPRIEPGHVDALTSVIAASLKGDISEGINAANSNPETRQALTQCAVRAAVAGAVSEAAGQ